MSVSAWKRLTTWSPSGDFAFDKVASFIFGANGASPTQDVGVGPLISYWSLSQPYTLGSRSLTELDTDKCGTDTGVACWDVTAMLGRIEKSLAEQGQCR